MEKNPTISPQHGWEELRNVLDIKAREMFLIKEINKKISLYIVEEDMYDSVIQESTRSLPIREKLLWIMIYIFIYESKLAVKLMDYELDKEKVYVFHFQKENGATFTRFIVWKDGGWGFGDFVFDNYLWPKTKNKEIIFLYFNEERVI